MLDHVKLVSCAGNWARSLRARRPTSSPLKHHKWQGARVAAPVPLNQVGLAGVHRPREYSSAGQVPLHILLQDGAENPAGAHDDETSPNVGRGKISMHK
ncbi:unnamed protein product [Pylaiella littoralis]